MYIKLQIISLLLLRLTVISESLNDMSDQFPNKKNWTNCKEFLHRTTLNLDSIIDVDWIIFYFWSTYPEISFHVRFSTPSFVLIDRFRSELDAYIMRAVDWSKADLFMETSIDFCALLIRTNVPGKYRLIPCLSFQSHSVPYLEISLKVVDGYLAFMNCLQKIAYALAPAGKVPNPLEIEAVASIFGVRNSLGQSCFPKLNSEMSSTPLPVNPQAKEFQNLEDVDLIL